MNDTPASPATATEARAVLDARIADKDGWAARYLEGGAAERREFTDLTEKIARGGDDVVTAAMNGDLPDVPSSEQRLMAGTAGWLRDLGFTEKAIHETLSDNVVPAPADIERARIVKAQADRSEEFQKRLLAGEPDAIRDITAANVILDKAARAKAWKDATGAAA
jgi:hypothetical protein